MRCEGCRRGVINAIQSIPGVTSVNVSLQTQTAVIDTLLSDTSKSVSDKEAIAAKAVAAIQKAGFKAAYVTNPCNSL
jgi:copper chaperone CopZ